MSGERIKSIEDRLDADYAGCFPSHEGWEKVAAHLLLAYDFTVRGADTRTVDKMKYALMHALRWGKGVPCCSFQGYPRQLDTSLFGSCRAVLWRGVEYTGICGAFISYHQKLVDVSDVEENQIAFTPTPSWKAYDVLDERLAFHQRETSVRIVRDLQGITSEIVAGLDFDQPHKLTHWFPNFGMVQRILSPVNRLLGQSFLLPQSWMFDGISVLQMRHFWRAIVILALLQCAVAYRLTGSRHTSLVQLLVRRRNDLADWIARCVGIDRGIASRILDLHTYDRSHRVPDIAVTPFLPLDEGIVAASPWMLVSSAFERNFCAYAARQHERAYDDASSVLAPHLAQNLVVAFTKAGFKATDSISFKDDEDQGDVDLLVWSPDERCLMAAELKWFIGTADFMEVLHREKTIREEAVQSQLPKYSRLLAADAGAFVAKAFHLRSSPRIDDWSCGALVRGFVGSPRIPDEEYFFLPERLVQAGLHDCASLRKLCEWAHNKPYLPVEGRDFRMYPYEVTSPSDTHVRFWEWEEIANHAASAHQ